MKIPKAELIDVDKIKRDKTNPNVLGEIKFKALKKVIKKYGFLIPIITNKNLVIADGENRWRAVKELKFKQVPVIKLDVDEVDRRILRQILNKLKGEHDPLRDLKEYRKILDEVEIDKFSDLIGQSEEYIKDFVNSKEERIEQWISLRTLTLEEEKRFKEEKVFRINLTLTEKQAKQVKKKLKEQKASKKIFVLEDSFLR